MTIQEKIKRTKLQKEIGKTIRDETIPASIKCLKIEEIINQKDKEWREKIEEEIDKLIVYYAKKYRKECSPCCIVEDSLEKLKQNLLGEQK